MPKPQITEPAARKIMAAVSLLGGASQYVARRLFIPESPRTRDAEAEQILMGIARAREILDAAEADFRARQARP